MSKKWHKGPPPSIGWWPASAWRNDDSIRWWDGRVWSLACSSVIGAEKAGHAALVGALTPQSQIEWQRRPKSWPARSHT